MWKGEQVDKELNNARVNLKEKFTIIKQENYNISYKNLGGTIIVWERLNTSL